DEVGGLILQYPALLIPDAARKGEMLWMKFDPNDIPEQMWSGPMCIGKRYVTDVMEIDTLPTITQYTGNVLIIHGDNDTLVNVSGSENAKDAYLAAGANVRMEIIEGGKHIFLKPKHINAAKLFISEFAKNIKK
ncbi:MAG: alpha/beta hydrolase family protein, partial [Candidatus Scatosoma sp.]